MKKIVKINSSNYLDIDWLHMALITICGGVLSMLSLLVNVKIAEITLILTFVIDLYRPLYNYIILITNRNLVSKIMKIIRSERLQDFTFTKNHCYLSNGVIVSVFENNTLYRLDFHANGITRSDMVYHLENRISEAFESEVVDIHRYSWGMSYLVKK